MRFKTLKFNTPITSLKKCNKNYCIFLIYILWSILVNFSFGYKLRPAYVIALALLFIGITKLSRWLGVFLITLFSIIAALYLPAAMMYGPPSVNTVSAIRYTSLAESIEFIKIIPTTSLALIFLLLSLCLCCNVISKEISRLNKWRILCFTFIAIITVLFRPVVSYVKDIDFSYHSFDFAPARFISDIYDANQTIINDELDSAKLLAMADDWKPSTYKTRYNTYILVVGESVRKDYLNAYGYKIQNTPFLSQAAGIFFNNYFSTSFSTVLSLTSTLYPHFNGKIEYNNSIIRLAKKAGFKTFWLSNQGRFGIHDGPVANIGKQADVSYFIKNGDSDDEHYYPDSALIPLIESAVLDRAQKKLIVLHLMGSHPGACYRTREKYEVFHKSKEISCYIQSIKETDALLKKITTIANNAGTKWSMLYFADHGLRQYNKDEGDVYMEHDDQVIQSFMPPFLIIGYDDTQRFIVSHKRSGFDFVPTFAQWLGIKDKRINDHCNFLSDRECNNSIKVINNNQQLTSIETLGSDPAI